MGRPARWFVAAAVALASAGAVAGALTVQECFEGSDFIANAARARDNGISRQAFIGRLTDDIELIQAYPPALRWFAKDEDDERFLVAQAQEVFDAPQSPEGHRARFLAACFTRASA